MITYLSLGSNLGDREHNLDLAVELLSQRVGHVLRRSSIYKSKSWGYVSENDYFNICVSIETSLSPLELLSATQEIERDLGRTHKTVNSQYHDRTIDIDILIYSPEPINLNNLEQLPYGQQINLPNLTIPHPLMTQRDFVLIPLKQII